ncbi:RagB/SusD family nutrient uptake outer membrane protein [Robertkochia solimangrovi]|uniref:RagB/SusD family nutrient uptake outer membrane protein n=1 Tax=Robertkochia solimangrovi TaxID=2213046 RepID=UPI00117CCB52|nr:RagB/SusD family nutrient uptake outer membrane protein [Robertkochia solimangrovi]TRZ42051.1 RagB/SusD family nutrient uptake outer membrane protein [Robertkochia solimangrovi]
MKKYLYTAITMALLATGCTNDEEFLDREPTNILTEEQVFSDPSVTLSVLANLYDRYYDFGWIQDWWTLSDFNIAFWSELGRYSAFQNSTYDYGAWGTWDYAYIREINLFIERCEPATELDEADKQRFLAEARFLRASYYFELVKRMGGVPLILEAQEYDFSGDASYLRQPRETEAAIYDFVISEAEAIKDMLPSNSGTKSRATKGAALAMEARAALYAGSIAKYGANTPQVSLPGNEVGIPVDKANGYYTKALNAAQQIINGEAGSYALYQKKPDLAENFASIFYDKIENPEVIFVEDYKLQSGKVHNFTIVNQPRFGAEEEEGGRINPSLQFVQSFETLDGVYQPLAATDGSGNPVYYENVGDIFEGRDARLSGTVILPGSSFKGRQVDIFAGYQMPDGSVVSGDSRGQQKEVGNLGNVQVVGFDGPIDGLEFTAQTGFYIRKFQDPKAGSGQRGVQSDVYQMRYRYAEVLLNAAEAAFELGNTSTAADYLNQVRSRAGITTPLTAGDVDFDRIAHERYVELAFEGLHFFDLKRWRIAHIVLDGVPVDENTVSDDIGSATRRETQPLAIWPYKVYEPGSANDGKFIYKTRKLSRVTGADRFQFGNYYSRIGDNVISNNPLIVRNPNQ